MIPEITIIGGNIAGLSAAYYLSKKGFYVTLYEAKLWNKPCGGAISLEFEQYLSDELNIVLEESDHYTERFKVGLWSGRYMEDVGVFRVTTRYDLQKKLIERLIKETNIEIKYKRVSFKDELFTPQTIVATGYSGFTNKVMERRWRFNDKALTLRYDGKFSGTYPNTNLIVLDHKKMGYGWVFVGKNDHINVGVGAVASREFLWNRFYDFFDLIADKYGYNIDPPSKKPQAWYLPIPTNKKKIPISNLKDGIEFIGVGDVLGLAHPLSGAGIEPAWQSGWVLSECITKNRIDTTRYQWLLLKNLRLSSWRWLDQFASIVSRINFPFKSTLGYFALHFIRHRMLTMMRKYPWFSLVHDGTKKTRFKS
ncbi:MAG: NAD(P)-binding protein [Candidatus Heimdallarchaeota archaeon]|nr:MAG: NAD(P)-binding protein [Candidatus Heimdallarchaeota archaeon]